METIRLELLDKSQVYYIPVSSENEVTEIVIDMSRAYEDWPLGSGEIWFRRPDGEFYLKDVTQEGGVLTAVLTDVDTAISGIAKVEGWWVDGTHLKKSPEYRLGIHQSFTTPDEIRSARVQALTLLAECEELLATMTETRDATYEARDMAAVARDEAMESAEQAAQYAQDADDAAQLANEYAENAATSAAAAAQSATDASGSAAIAQQERIDAQTAAQNAAADRAAIAGATDNAAASAAAAQQYAQLAMREHNGADAAYQAALVEQDKAQEARRDAQAAQAAAEAAKDGAVSAMNTAAENSDQTEQLYATFLQQYESIDQRLTALEQKLP